MKFWTLFKKMKIQTYPKLFAVFLIIVQIWTVKSQSEVKLNATTNSLNEGKIKPVNYENVISNLKEQLSQCLAQNETQTESPLSTILSGIQQLKAKNCNNDVKLKEKDQLIASQKSQIEDKAKLLDNEINETIKSRQEVFDYIEQIKILQSIITSFNTSINQHNATKSNLTLEHKRVNGVQLNEIIELRNEINQIELNHTSCIKQIDDDFKKCESDKEELQDEVRRSLSNLNGRRGSYEGDIERAEVSLKVCKALNAEITKKLNSKEKELNECFIKTKQLPTVPPQLPSSCLNLSAGVHEIQIENGKYFNVVCDDNGWLIIQQRFNGSQDFNKTWKEYMDGFGDLQSEFFIGLENLHLITSLKQFELHIGVTFEWGKRFAHYDNFRIGDAESLYELEEIGHYEGDEFNALAEILNTKFTTFDLNNIVHSVENCAEDGMGGWWYSKYCGNSNLNARYEGEIRWYLPKVKSTIMKIRPNSDGN